jgi:hypothetical protein
MGYWDNRRCDISELEGHTIADVQGLEVGNDDVTFVLDNGKTYRLYHSQECCEWVSIHDLEGGPAELVGARVFTAAETSNEDEPELEDKPESYTWTFYNIRTDKGYVFMRWLGQSNGYYSEGVSFEEVTAEA